MQSVVAWLANNGLLLGATCLPDRRSRCDSRIDQLYNAGLTGHDRSQKLEPWQPERFPIEGKDS